MRLKKHNVMNLCLLRSIVEDHIWRGIYDSVIMDERFRDTVKKFPFLTLVGEDN